MTWTTGTNTLAINGSITGTTVSGTTVTDGFATMTGDVLTAGTITDGTASLTSGAWTGVSSISGLSAPSGATDAANKAYVDAATGTAPGLPAQSVQFNSDPAGVFTGDSNFTWNTSSQILNVTGSRHLLEVNGTHIVREITEIILLDLAHIQEKNGK